MYLQGSRLLLSFTCFFALLQAAVGIECRPGEKATQGRDKCEPCPSKQYRPSRGDFTYCLNCIPCKNSRQLAPCTSINNTKCECWEGFSFLPRSKEECRCEKGSGIEQLENGEKICKKCPNGTFSSSFNSACQPWKLCDHSGIKVPGTDKSDVTCQVTPKTEEPSVSPHHPTIVTYQTSANASAMASTRTATTRTVVSTSTTPGSVSPGIMQMQLQYWLVPLSCIPALLLIQLAIIKLKVKPCFLKKKIRVIRQDSTCGKPVEESGEKFIPSAV